MKYIKVFYLILLTCLAFNQPSDAAIRECTSTQEMLVEATPGALLIFDIDNTILQPVQQLGSDPWFFYFIDDLKRQGLDHKAALNRAIDVLHRVYHVTRVRPIEVGTMGVIDQLQQNGFPVMAMTARSCLVTGPTLRHLGSCGIDFSTSPPCKEDFHLTEMPIAYWNTGILFTEGSHRGKALHAFLRQIKMVPKKVVFINDKYEQLKQVEEILNSTEIEYVGLRYSGADKSVEAFRPEIARAQLEYFEHILCDDKASLLLQNTSR